MSQLKTNVSFELFPSLKQLKSGHLERVVQRLNYYNPRYFSVTFGAGGSASYANSLALIRLLRAKEIEVVPHITCFHLSKAQIFELLKQYIELSITKLVVVRGDMPQDTSCKPSFNYAYQLIDYIRQISGEHFDITVAAYPEFYPGSKSLQEDIDNLKFKISAGANRAITQYFYSVDAFHHFAQLCQENDINIPISPGIMPIANYQKLKKFSDICFADIPQWLDKRLQSYDQDSEQFKSFCANAVARLCQELIKLKVPSLHFYALNQIEAVDAVLSILTQNKILTHNQHASTSIL